MAKSSTQSFEDSAAMKLVLDTHSSDGDHKVDVSSLLDIIDKILLRATPSIASALSGTEEKCLSEEKGNAVASSAPLGELHFVINKVFCELTCKCSSDTQTKTMEILKTLSKYSWEAKAVLTMAAFAVIYGELGLFAQLYFSNPLAKYIALLKSLPEIIEHGESLKPQFDAITTLLKAVMELTKCIVGFNDLNPKFVLMCGIHKPVYWIIHSLVACATQIATLTGFTEGAAATFSISTLTIVVNNTLKFLKAQFDVFQKFNGLGTSFLPFVQSLEGRFQDMSLNDLHGLLQNEEFQFVQDAVPPPHFDGGFHGRGRFINGHTSTGGRSYQFHSSATTTFGNYKNNTNNLVCHHCMGYGHMSHACPSQMMRSGSSFPIEGPKPTPHLAADTVASHKQPWTANGGATHHSRAEPGHLSQHSNHKGPNKVPVGNGHSHERGGHSHWPM